MLSAMIPFQFPGLPGVGCAFSLRAFGSVSLAGGAERAASEQRRVSLPSLLGVSAFAEVHQVHGTRTIFEPEAQPPRQPPVEQADGMATSRPDLALMIKTADCQPILVAHASGRFVMAVHAGWRGNRQGYPQKAVEEFCGHYGLEPRDLWAVRGPSLGPAASEFVNFAEEWGQEYLPWYEEACRSVDLWQLARSQLESAGLLPGRILSLDLCTFENWRMFFSYRHARRMGSEDGRQGSFIWIRPA
ncbi:polyphenol oxidase family protein [Mailhella massiliensis]|uniref:Polyphenol oxidase family protein n=1 Tax=Mailhella massiliensis TaxID=1903261 RepID=A0A921AWV3_9BACT|nr:polyphenol oxidase family protein [Mailhella massiliensis]HJD97800.1 polyphenol oxidase family protein [Mailhella massiliensis]